MDQLTGCTQGAAVASKARSRKPKAPREHKKEQGSSVLGLLIRRVGHLVYKEMEGR